MHFFNKICNMRFTSMCELLLQLAKKIKKFNIMNTVVFCTYFLVVVRVSLIKQNEQKMVHIFISKMDLQNMLYVKVVYIHRTVIIIKQIMEVGFAFRSLFNSVRQNSNFYKHLLLLNCKEWYNSICVCFN